MNKSLSLPKVEWMLSSDNSVSIKLYFGSEKEAIAGYEQVGNGLREGSLLLEFEQPDLPLFKTGDKVIYQAPSNDSRSALYSGLSAVITDCPRPGKRLALSPAL